MFYLHIKLFVYNEENYVVVVFCIEIKENVHLRETVLVLT